MKQYSIRNLIGVMLIISLFLIIVRRPVAAIVDSGGRTPSLKREEISNGMHVYTSLAVAKAVAKEYLGEILVKFTANVADVLGVDEDGVAVFKKLHLAEGEYKRAMKVK